MREWHNQSIVALISEDLIHRIQGVVVCFGIQCTKSGGLVGCDLGHTATPQSTFFCIRIGTFFNFGEHVIVVALQRLMVAGRASEIKHELRSTHQSHTDPNKALVDPKTPQNVTDSGGAQQHDCEVKDPVPPLKTFTTSSVVQSISQSIEFEVGYLSFYELVHFFAPGDFGDFAGCRTPALATLFVGWRTPFACAGLAFFVIDYHLPLRPHSSPMFWTPHRIIDHPTTPFLGRSLHLVLGSPASGESACLPAAAPDVLAAMVV